MIIPDLKKAVTTIIASRKSGKGEPLSAPAPVKDEKSMMEDGEPDGRHAAATDMLSAFHEKSPQKLLEALGNFIELHHIHSAKQSEEESEE